MDLHWRQAEEQAKMLTAVMIILRNTKGLMCVFFLTNITKAQ